MFLEAQLEFSPAGSGSEVKCLEISTPLVDMVKTVERQATRLFRDQAESVWTARKLQSPDTIKFVDALTPAIPPI
jgi:hypothetical protein